MVKRRKRRYTKPKQCSFCKENRSPDYKEVDTLKNFISPRGRILSRAKTGICAKHQRKLARAIKRARFLALLPFVAKVKEAR